ncbi:hypothetical protein [Superficieibacter electus]|uniref:hypothetical protein n=1 Tax=Superficieibacter electus TaxID=2022662 RepID=UPI001FEBE015|nr:hypothetical protein [Superficieibacter electus]
MDLISRHYPSRFRISKEYGEGLVSHGTRQWRDYRLQSQITLHLGDYGGLAFRIQGMRRYYALQMTQDEKIQLIRVRDDSVTVLAEQGLKNIYEREVNFDVAVKGHTITATVDGMRLYAEDATTQRLDDGGVGLVVCGGALSMATLQITPVE